MQVLGGPNERSRIISVEEYRSSEDISPDSLVNLLYLRAAYPKNFFGFGYPKVRGSFKSYLLQDPETDEWEIWATSRWIHVCIAYRKRDGFLKVIKDGKPLNVNGPDKDLTQVHIPDNFLDMVVLGRCNRDFKYGCSPPEGQITDFNIWDQFLETNVLQDWTLCRSLHVFFSCKKIYAKCFLLQKL